MINLDVAEAVMQAEFAFKKLEDKKTVTAEQRQIAQELIGNSRKLHEELVKASEELGNIESEAKSSQQQLGVYEKERKRNEKRMHVRSLFEQAREMLHREHLPKVVMSSVLVRLNYFLDKFVHFFELPFVAEINEDFDFVTHYPMKSNVPASRASGGQKVALSIAYHLAWAEALAGSVPLMVLDEPTNHLDEPHRKQICEVLERIRKIASKGTVFMVATHDPILYPAFNRHKDVADLLK